MAVGGFLAVTYLRNRASTEDIDYILDPEWANDEAIKKPNCDTISEVAHMHKYSPSWANADIGCLSRNRRNTL